MCRKGMSSVLELRARYLNTCGYDDVELERSPTPTKVGTASMMMSISIDSTANRIQLWGKIYTARGQTDGGWRE